MIGKQGGGGDPVALWEMLYPVIQQFETLPAASRHLSGIQRHFEGKILNLETNSDKKKGLKVELETLLLLGEG